MILCIKIRRHNDIKYITNKELLAEIQKSKATYCYFTLPEYASYDAVVTSLELLTPEFIAAALQTKLAKLAKAGVSVTGTPPVVFRVISDLHLPEETDEKRRKRSSTGGWIPRTNFPPFQHFVWQDEALIEVGRSHWKGDLETGQFCQTHGKINDRLARMFLLLVEQYSKSGNWRSYSYVLDMRSQALVQLSQVGLQFDETRSDNPFAWYTQITKNSFRRTWMLEKRSQDIRDDLLIMAGAMPSHTRQIDDELEQKSANMSDVHVVGKALGSDPEGNLIHKEAKRRGRKPKPR